jgi:hypothetical protein
MVQKLSMELDVVFQSLLQGVAEANGMLISGKAGFDSQAGQFKAFGAADFVPMHQAKVLDRSDHVSDCMLIAYGLHADCMRIACGLHADCMLIAC